MKIYRCLSREYDFWEMSKYILDDPDKSWCNRSEENVKTIFEKANFEFEITGNMEKSCHNKFVCDIVHNVNGRDFAVTVTIKPDLSSGFILGYSGQSKNGLRKKEYESILEYLAGELVWFLDNEFE